MDFATIIIDFQKFHLGRTSDFIYYFSFEEERKGKTGGSRRKFVDAYGNIINLHKPHPRNIFKEYAIKQVIERLRELELLVNE